MFKMSVKINKEEMEVEKCVGIVGLFRACCRCCCDSDDSDDAYSKSKSSPMPDDGNDPTAPSAATQVSGLTAGPSNEMKPPIVEDDKKKTDGPLESKEKKEPAISQKPEDCQGR